MMGLFVQITLCVQFFEIFFHLETRLCRFGSTYVIRLVLFWAVDFIRILLL